MLKWKRKKIIDLSADNCLKKTIDPFKGKLKEIKKIGPFNFFELLIVVNYHEQKQDEDYDRRQKRVRNRKTT